MKSILNFRVIAVVLCFAVLAGACDREELERLKTETTKLEETANEQNETLTSLSKKLEECKVKLAKVSKSATVIRAKDEEVDVPALTGDVNVATLRNHKDALNTVISEQNTQIDSLTSDNEECGDDLARARRAAKKPKATRIQEKKGKPTTGAASRYKRR